MDEPILRSHRLVLPGDANHHGTLFAGSLLQIALETAYATATRFVGPQANLVLRRVLSIECYQPVPVGTLIEMQGAVIHLARAYLVVGLLGTPLAEGQQPWMDGLFGFAQIDGHGRAAPLPEDLTLPALADPTWEPLQTRLGRLLPIRHGASWLISDTDHGPTANGR